MTREEAIYELKNAAWLGTDHSRARTEEAVEMAIKALSQDPCDDAISRKSAIKIAKCISKKAMPKYLEQLPSVNPQPCDDAISREQAIYVASGYCHPANVAKELAKLPSVTHKSGKWINDKDDMPTCSECGYIPQYDRAIDDYEYSNYYPRCGAKMVEPQESEE